MKLTLIEDAGKVWHRLWSVRLAILAALLGGVDVALSILAPAHATPLYALGAALASVAATIARLIVQRNLPGRSNG